jgi:hypothetical protein
LTRILKNIINRETLEKTLSHIPKKNQDTLQIKESAMNKEKSPNILSY